MTLKPNGEFKRYADGPGWVWLTARLYRSGGSWWLEYEDGHTTDTRHQANGKNAYKRDHMLRILRSATGSDSGE